MRENLRSNSISMAAKKIRKDVPKSIWETVMKEFRYRCAFCGRDKPQLHHIDEDPSNNTLGNLLPLCPNHHLQDIHDPTGTFDKRKVMLFRRCKDPLILDPRFQPIWKRITYLRIPERWDRINFDFECQDLVRFVTALQMGAYYGPKINAILQDPLDHMAVHEISQALEHSKEVEVSHESILKRDPSHNEAYDFRASAVEDLCVELLRFQGWEIEETS